MLASLVPIELAIRSLYEMTPGRCHPSGAFHLATPGVKCGLQTMWSTTERRLLATEGDHGIDLHGAAGGQIAGQQSYKEQDQGRT
jgi:hypothetical protein